MKATIIGGGGRVGSNAAFALQCAGVVSEIQLLDANEEMAEGEALDLMHGASSIADQRIYAGGYERAADTDIFIITAGSRRKPDESRLDLINRNVSLFSQIMGGIRDAGYKAGALFFVVSNPVDILTHLATSFFDVPSKRVFGLGTMLDTARFRSLIAQELDLAPTQVRALILGEHGDSMAPIWSSATVGGLPLSGLASVTPAMEKRLFERTQKSGAEVISRKGGAGWAVGATIAEIVNAVVLDQRRLLPVSTLAKGAYGIRETCLSLPTVVGIDGATEHVELELWPKEKQGLVKSAAALRETMAKVAG